MRILFAMRPLLKVEQQQEKVHTTSTYGRGTKEKISFEWFSLKKRIEKKQHGMNHQKKLILSENFPSIYYDIDFNYQIKTYLIPFHQPG